MILESIYTQCIPEKDLGQRFDQKQKNAESDQATLFTENTRKKKGMIVLMPRYHKEPIATGSVIKHCNFLMK